MTEQEKELGIFIAECVNGLPDSGNNFKDCFTLAKAIIQRYPQILAEEVLDGVNISGQINLAENLLYKNLKVFIMEVQS